MTSPLLAIAGTGTEVGKTWFAVGLGTEARRRGLTVVARKPAQSFEPGEEGTTDADRLAVATGADRYEVCPRHRWYPTPMAPVMAAESLGRPPFTTAELVAELDWSNPGQPTAELRLLETAGGLRSPLADDGDSLDLIRAAEASEVILVAHAGLGTLNDCRAAVEALRSITAETRIVLNRYDENERLHRLNRSWLQDREGLRADPPAEALESILSELATSDRAPR